VQSKSFLIFISIILFIGCSSNSLLKKNTQSNICTTEPLWILNFPHKKNVIYGVGIAPKNFNGIKAQRKSAISQAINEIAYQLNTKVNSQFIIHEEQNNNFANKYYKNISFQTINNQNINAKIIKFCENPSTGYLYVLMGFEK